jgi:Lamin Tail Domain
MTLGVALALGGPPMGSAVRVALCLALVACGSDHDEELVVTPMYSATTARVVVGLSKQVDGDIHVEARRGNFGSLDCADLAARTAPLARGDELFVDGPSVDPALLQPFYGPEWMMREPTPEMIATARAGVDSIVDVCIMDGNKVVARIESDLFAAWDAGKANRLDGKADNVQSGEVQINSAQVYGMRCVDVLGEIPFFEKQADGTYTTYSCLEGTPVPMTITRPDGTVDAPQSGTANQCDNPQYIYSSCEAGPRVQTRTNALGTRWTMLCRKSIGGFASDQYNDIAMIGHNPYTGKTCFFQNALYVKTDGGQVPHPADPVKSVNLWSGVQGGLGSGIECARCHDADAFIHSPWIDAAKDPQGRPIVPKMGVDPDYPLGVNDAPYSLVNAAGQGWTMKQQLVSPQANACLRCHRIGAGEFATNYMSRLDGTNAAWTALTTAKYNEAAHKYWMPPNVAFPTDASFQSSEYQTALDFIQTCGANPAAPGCTWADVPTTVSGGGSGAIRNPVNLDDNSLASQATTILGFNRNTPSQQCAECHAPTQTTLNGWLETTDRALATCLSETTGGEDRNDTIPSTTVAQGEFKVFGPYEVAAGSRIEVHMTGTGDADLYVKRGSEPSLTSYDCRPYAGGSAEDCTSARFRASGPAKFWVGMHGYTAATATATVTYRTPGTTVQPASARVACMRLEPSQADSPFTSTKLGIYAAAAHLGWFEDTFRAAFPDGDDVWALQYGLFKNRVAMPKGNHPRFTQAQFDIVAEWFDRGMPLLTTYIAPDTGPTTCTTTIGAGVATHATQMATQGWGRVNKNAGMAMFGCGAATDPRQCLTSLPDATTKPYGTGWANAGTLRVLRELTFNTVFWMRSSADGRFVANGATGGSGGKISDLQTGKDINVSAAYDPGFFPDNRGWMFQGTPIGAGFCTTSLLVANPDSINFSETACSSVSGVGLYQHLGAGISNADYFAINAQFTSDFPGGGVTHDPNAGFSSSAQMSITPMVFDGAHWVPKPPAIVPSPSEGDAVLSPSTGLIASRFGTSGNQLGFVLRKVTATPNAASYTVTAPEIARYCTKGGKPAFSFDERYMVYHHYVGPADYAALGFATATDPVFQNMLAKGTANVMMLDLVTGQEKRITSMHAGQYALYPHFRSDGWIYFLARDLTTNKEYVIASDAALVASGPTGPQNATLDPHDASVAQGGSVTLTVTLDALAPAGGATVALSVSPAGAGTLPSSVTVPAGQTSASFTFTDSAPSGTVTITATFAGNTSTANITVQTGGTTHLVINEIDYDMPSSDNAEFIEIYNPRTEAVSLAGKKLLLVNGANGLVYSTVNLSGTIAAQGYVVVAGANVSVPAPAVKLDPGWTSDKIQNGSPDGVALVDGTTLIDAVSYEGAMTAVSLPGFATPVSLVEGTATPAADSASANGICRKQNQDTNNAAVDWVTCVKTPGAANP